MSIRSNTQKKMEIQKEYISLRTCPKSTVAELIVVLDVVAELSVGLARVALFGVLLDEVQECHRSSSECSTWPSRSVCSQSRAPQMSGLSISFVVALLLSYGSTLRSVLLIMEPSASLTTLINSVLCIVHRCKLKRFFVLMTSIWKQPETDVETSQNLGGNSRFCLT